MKVFYRLSDWYFSSRALPYWCVLFIDCLTVFFSSYVGSYLEFGGDGFAQNFWQLTAGNLICVLIFGVCFRLFHTYTGILRYSSLIDLERVGKAAFVGSCLSYLVSIVMNEVGTDGVIMHQSLRGNLMMFICSAMLMWVERMMVRAMFDGFMADKAQPVAIYGTKSGEVSLANSILTTREKKYMLQAFISDGPEMRNAYIMGKRVFLNKKGIAQQMRHLHVKVLLVSPLKTEKFRDNQAMVDEFVQAGIKIMMMPAAEEWDGKSKLTYNQLREIEIEDLLPREKIEVDMNAIGEGAHHRRCRIHRFGDGETGGYIQACGDDTHRPGGDADARCETDYERPVCRREEPDHRGQHHRQAFHGEDIRGAPSGIRVPCRCLQACADDGGQSCHGGAQQRERHPHHSRPCREIRHEEVCDDINRQGGEPNERDGLLEANMRDILSVAEPGYR